MFAQIIDGEFQCSEITNSIDHNLPCMKMLLQSNLATAVDQQQSLISYMYLQLYSVTGEWSRETKKGPKSYLKLTSGWL